MLTFWWGSNKEQVNRDKGIRFIKNEVPEESVRFKAEASGNHPDG